MSACCDHKKLGNVMKYLGTLVVLLCLLIFSVVLTVLTKKKAETPPEPQPVEQLFNQSVTVEKPGQ